MSKLIGTNPNQVPTNADLGTMAYMDYDAVSPVLRSGRKNLIVNGAMQVWQRALTYSAGQADGYLAADRWRTNRSLQGSTGTKNISITRSTDAPENFSFSQKAVIDLTGYSPATNYDYIQPFVQYVDTEYANVLGWGNSDISGAKSATLSFWYKSTLVGTHTLFIRLEPSSSYNPSTSDSLFHAGFEVTQSNVWKKYVIHIPPITTNQQWDPTTSGRALSIAWNPISYQAYAHSYNGGDYEGKWYENNNWGGIVPDHDPNQGFGESNEFYLTGVQLEVGDVATEFEHKPYGEVLAECQRYFTKVTDIWLSGLTYGTNGSSDGYISPTLFPSTMRAIPSVAFSGGSDGGSNAGVYVGNVSTTQLSINLRSTDSSQNVWWRGLNFEADAEL